MRKQRSKAKGLGLLWQRQEASLNLLLYFALLCFTPLLSHALASKAKGLGLLPAVAMLLID